MANDRAGCAHDHSRWRERQGAWWALALTSTYLIAKVRGSSIVFNGLALLPDIAHMMTWRRP